MSAISEIRNSLPKCTPYPYNVYEPTCFRCPILSGIATCSERLAICRFLLLLPLHRRKRGCCFGLSLWWPLYLSKLVTHANLGHSAAEAALHANTNTNFLPPTYQRRKEKKKKEPHPFFALCMPKTERGNGRDREADVAYFFGPFLCILTPHMAFLPILE